MWPVHQRLPLNERLIFAVQIKSGFERDGIELAKCFPRRVKGVVTVNFAPVVRFEPEPPLDVVRRQTFTKGRLVPPLGQTGIGHVPRQVECQLAFLKPRQPPSRSDFEHSRGCERGCDNGVKTAQQHRHSNKYKLTATRAWVEAGHGTSCKSDALAGA